jgi:hypothetical protein
MGDLWNHNQPATNPVTNPKHYTSGPAECIDVLRHILSAEAFEHYCVGTAFAYIWRVYQKDEPEKNLLKAQWYISWACGEDPRG